MYDTTTFFKLFFFFSDGGNYLKVLVDVEVVYIVVLQKNIVSVGNFLFLYSFPLAFLHLVYPLSKEGFSARLSCELKEKF
jgi:hypothetical protein